MHLIEALTEEHDQTALCITETWITASKIDLLHIEGYNVASLFCRSNREGGGTGILLKTGIEYNECRDITELSLEYVFEVSAIIIIKLNILLIVLYWPNNNREVNIFNGQLEKLLNIVKSKHSSKNVIIGGDMNIDFLNKNKQCRDIINLFKSYNLTQNVKDFTRVTEKSSSCLDFVFTNFSNTILSVDVIDYGLSDHKGVEITMMNNNEQKITGLSTQVSGFLVIKI